MNIGFSINLHDSDGDKFDDCILIHIEDRIILRFADTKELGDFIKQLEELKTEIETI